MKIKFRNIGVDNKIKTANLTDYVKLRLEGEHGNGVIEDIANDTFSVHDAFASLINILVEKNIIDLNEVQSTLMPFSKEKIEQSEDKIDFFYIRK